MPTPAETSPSRPSIYMFADNKPMTFIVILVLALLGYFAYGTIYNKTTRLITTVGTGTKKVTAQKVILTFVVTQDAGDRSSAVTNGEAKFADVMETVQTFNPSDIVKTVYQIIPRTNQLTGDLKGFQYVSGAQITLTGTDNTANIVRALTQKDAAVASVRYLPLDEKAESTEIRKLAIEDARMKAEQMANAAGASLGKVMNISEQTTNSGNSVTSQSTPQTSFNQPTGTAPSAFNDIELQSSVQVTFELK